MSFVPCPVVRWAWACSDLFDLKLAVAFRYLCLQRLCRKCGDNVYIGRFVTFRYLENVSIGSNVSIHTGCYLDACGGIDIGSEVSIAHQSSVLSSTHSFGDRHIPIRENPMELGRVVIKDDVWVGCGVRILSGVTIGSRTVVGAGTVVNKSIGGGIYVGVPARMVRDLGGPVPPKGESAT